MNKFLKPGFVASAKNVLLAGLLFTGAILLSAFVSGDLKDPAHATEFFFDSGY